MEGNRKSSRLPILMFVVFPLLILILLILVNWFLSQCLTSTKVYTELAGTSSVLGVSTFDLSSSKTSVLNDETFNYTLSLTTDNDLGLLTSTVIFNLAGEGRIGEDITGPGICVRVSELRASCTAINLLPEQTLSWTVPVTAKSTCSLSASPILTMIATHSSVGLVPEVSEDTSIVTCVASSTTPDDGNNGNNNGNNSGNTDTTDTSNIDSTTNLGGLNSKDVFAILGLHNEQVMQCYSNKMMYLGVGLVAVLLLSLFLYFGMRRDPVVTE